jgi:acetylornithine/succinyldiaminopimelate/putrescine aminotransferase
VCRGNAVLDIFEREKLLERANSIGRRLRAGINRLSRANNLLPISAARGPGAMIAADGVAGHLALVRGFGFRQHGRHAQGGGLLLGDNPVLADARHGARRLDGRYKRSRL